MKIWYPKRRPENILELLKVLLSLAIEISLIFVIIPAAIVTINSFVSKVIIGDMLMSDYKDSLPLYSYMPVFDFYLTSGRWLKEVWYRLIH